jgi:hypothetical protein
MNGEGEVNLIGKLRDGFRAAAKYRALLSIEALQIVKEIAGGYASGDAKAGAVREGAIRFKKDASVVVPDGFLVLCLTVRGAGAAGEEKQDHSAGDSAASVTHEW